MKKELIASLLLSAGGLFADAQLENLAKELVEKRTEVDSISTELDIKKSEIKALQESTEAQKTDLQRLIKAEETLISKFNQDITKLEKDLKTQEVPSDEIKPILFSSLDALEKHVSGGIPFKKDARLAEVKQIREMLTNDQLVPEKALSKVWSMLESEFRLTRENGLYRQNIEMDGKIHLADIVKIGMNKLFFKISETQVGEVISSGAGDRYVVATKKEDVESLNVLFDNFQKKIRTGYFVFPKL